MPSGLFLEEIGSPDGARRADALWIPNHGQGIIGHETKTSRSDLRAELLDPIKAESWKRYCRKWWLVVSEAKIVDGLEIPEDWGIKTPPTAANRRQFTVIRDAPTLVPADITPALHRIATVIAYERQRREWIDARHQNEVTRLERLAAEARGGFHTDPGSKKFAEVAAELDKRKFTYQFLQPEEIADAIVHAREVKEIRENLERVARQRLDTIKRAMTGLTGDWAYKNLVKILGEEVSA